MKAPISEFEEELISEYIHLSFLIETLESDLKTIDLVPLKLKTPYVLLIEEKLKKVRSDLKTVKAKMKEFNIKIFPQRRVDDMFVEYPYFARGYHGVHRYWDAALRFAGIKRLEKYFMKLNMLSQKD
jgi:hypothetical protein